LFGVRFSDIDFAKGLIVLTRQLQDGVDLPEFREDPRRFAGGLVFTSPEGEALNLSNFHRRVWRPTHHWSCGTRVNWFITQCKPNLK
jgi:hypothetical protein